jgi:Mn2+/Fe2+ NRAMP family transporter
LPGESVINQGCIVYVPCSGALAWAYVKIALPVALVASQKPIILFVVLSLIVKLVLASQRRIMNEYKYIG